MGLPEDTAPLVPGRNPRKLPIPPMKALTGVRGVMAIYVITYHFFGDFRDGEKTPRRRSS